MKRGHKFDCGHPGAVTMYCSTFSTIERVKLCPSCTTSINDNPQDPRFIGETISVAVDGRDEKHAPVR
jgi:hypothetical protein